MAPEAVKALDIHDEKGGGSAMTMKVELRDNEGFDGLLRRFTKDLQSSGVLREFRSKRRFVSKSEQRRMKMRKAEHKRRRKLAKDGETSTPASSRGRS